MEVAGLNQLPTFARKRKQFGFIAQEARSGAFQPGFGVPTDGVVRIKERYYHVSRD